VRQIFAGISPKLPEKILGHFLCDFHVILGAIFPRIFMEFSQIFSDFARIFNISKH